MTTAQKTDELDLNEKFQFAYDLLKSTKKNVFITGKAGTGKSTLLKYFRERTVKNVAVLAPTGVAAVNVGGQTIHSFFKFKPDITVENVEDIRVGAARRKLYENLDMIIIDEISMVRADLLDCIDAFLRFYGPYESNPFGGVQMIFFGDLFQLPPVVTGREQGIFRNVYRSPYFFDARSYPSLEMNYVELDKIYRQKEENFIDLLGRIRNRTLTQEHVDILNQRCQPHFKPNREDFFVYLTTTNALADQTNQMRLEELDSQEYYYNGEVTGNFEERNLPTNERLALKVGAQVMLLNNDPMKRWINGSIGKVISFSEDETMVKVELADGSLVKVTPYTWEVFQFSYNEISQSLESERVGSFTQYPLRLAWAVTIHKSQGKTFSNVIIDIGDGAFAPGQIYVALSRCTSLNGLVLKKPIGRQHIMLDPSVVQFMNAQQFN